MPKKIWTVVDDEGTYEAEPKRWSCSCGEDDCQHLEFISQLTEKDKGVGYVVVSALHKELRRGDIGKALHWAGWLRHVRGGDYAVKSYCRNVLFEETRNTDLWRKWQNIRECTGDEMVVDFCNAKKQWELKKTGELFPIWLEADVRAWGQGSPDREELEKEPPPGPFEYFTWIQRLHRIAVNGMKLKRDKRSADWRARTGVLKATLRRKLLAEGHELEAEMLKNAQCFHIMTTCIEALVGAKDPQALEIATKKVEPVDVDLLMPSDYAYDYHTRVGRMRVTRLFRRLQMGRRSPKTLDLRWTGANIGCWWRYAAFRQFGDDYRDQPWEAVIAPQEEWKLAVSSDKIWRGQHP